MIVMMNSNVYFSLYNKNIIVKSKEMNKLFLRFFFLLCTIK